MAIQPLGNRVLIRPAPQETTTKAGIILDGVEKERPERGTVVNLGAVCVLIEDRLLNRTRPQAGVQMIADNQAVEIAIGDTVLFKKYAADVVKDENGYELLLVDAKDIMARL